MGVGTVTLLSPEGKVTEVPVDQAGAYFAQGFKAATDADVAGTNAKAAREAGITKVESFAQSALRTATLGASDAVQRAFGGAEAQRYLKTARDANPISDTLGTAFGAIAPAALTGGESLAASLAEATPIGRASALGAKIASLGESSGTLGKIGYKALGSAAEGGLIGAGQGVSELALDDRPITWERATSALSSNALFGAATGGALGAVGGTVEAGLGKAKGMLDDVIAKRAVSPLEEVEPTAAAAVATPAATPAKVTLPSYADVQANEGMITTISARDLEANGFSRLPLPHLDEAGSSGKLRNAAKHIEEGQRDPISVLVDKDGGYYVDDGRHRLQAAIDADKPIKVEWSRGGGHSADEEFVQNVRTPAPASGPAPVAAPVEPTAPRTPLRDMDLKGLTKAREEELATLEANRIPQRQQIADDLAAFRKEVKDQKLWMATKDSTVADVRVIGKQTLKADRQLDTLLDNPKALAENPRRAMAALQQQEHALENLAKKADEIRATITDQAGPRAQALDNVPAALERNRALQARIKGITTEHASSRLAAIQDARDALQSGGPKKSLVEEMMGGTIFHKTSELAGGLAGSIPLAGGLLGPLAGGLVARTITNAVFGRLAKATTAQLQKTANAVQMFAGGVGKAARASVPLATKVLSRVSFGSTPPGASDGVKGTLAKAYADRSAELRNLTYYDETGTPRIRPEARQAMAERLSPIRHVAPLAADKMETNGVRRIETYAQMMPRLPDLGAPSGGPDTRRPSNFAMRGFARVIAVGENPAGFEHRVAAGKVTPEEIDAYKRIHPERAQDFISQIMQEVAQRPSKLPYQRRLTLSMVTGSPIDPSMHPAVMTVLQTMFRAEPGSQGGTMAPKPAPAFGSVKKSVEQPTPAQRRSQGV